MNTGTRNDAITRVAGRRVLVIAAHADDAAIFVGGTIRLLADQGCDVQIARFTDDCTDSFGLSALATIEINSVEFRESAGILGATAVHDLGFPSDTLGDVPRSVLRERAIRLIRSVRPYAVLTFDPYAAYGEDNQDHIRVGQEVDEAFWTSMFDKHHPEHFGQGMPAHGVVERWYFGRRLTEVTDVIDITAGLEAKAAAVISHRTMMGNLMRQLRLMGATAGILDSVLDERLSEQADLIGSSIRSVAAEEFRIVRFAGFHGLFDSMIDVTYHAGE